MRIRRPAGDAKSGRRRLQRHIAELERAGSSRRIERRAPNKGKLSNEYDLSGLVPGSPRSSPSSDRDEGYAENARTHLRTRCGYFSLRVRRLECHVLREGCGICRSIFMSFQTGRKSRGAPRFLAVPLASGTPSPGAADRTDGRARLSASCGGRFAILTEEVLKSSEIEGELSTATRSAPPSPVAWASISARSPHRSGRRRGRRDDARRHPGLQRRSPRRVCSAGTPRCFRPAAAA